MIEFPEIEGYRIEHELGKGGMATVYLAFQEKLNRKVAIKVLNPMLMAESSSADRFLKEAETAAGLHHPNIIPIFDVGQTGRWVYMVMEYLGMNLKDRICASRIPPEECLRILRQMAAALEYAHSKGIVHRDIKPENIMFREEGTAVLVDFGIARAVGEATRMTKMGMSIGTPHYMSPEQARGLDLDGRSDLYALGIVFYEMITGWVPFEAQDSVAIIFKHVQDPIPRLPPHLSRWQSIVDALLAKDRSQRISTGKELAVWIEDIEKGGTGLIAPESKRDTRFGFRKSDTKTKDSIRRSGSREVPQQLRNKVSSSSDTWKKSWGIPILVGVLAVAVGILVLLLSSGKSPQIQDADFRESDRYESEQIGSVSTFEEERNRRHQDLMARAREALEAEQPETARSYLELAKKERGNTEELKLLELLIETLETRLLKAEKEEPRPKPPQPKLAAKDVKDDRSADEAAFRIAMAANTKAAYEIYLKEFPDGRYKPEAQKMIDGFEKSERETRDAQAFEKAEKADTIEAYQDYLTRFPEGKFRTAAKQKASVLEEAARPPEKAPVKRPLRRSGDEINLRVGNFEIDLVYIAPGEFMMGWNEGAPDEKPEHRVTISKGFWMGKYEVTQKQWITIMGTNPSAFPKGGNYPVENVSWDDVQTFIRELNRQVTDTFRLPTEAEWEYAARSGISTERYGELNAIAWFSNNSRGSTRPVGGRRQNAWGLHDMLGNVWEWCSDRYGADYYSASPNVDPPGPSVGVLRVFRGGGFSTVAGEMRVSFRNRSLSTSRENFIGFRLVRDE